MEINAPAGSFTQKMASYLSSNEATLKSFAFDRVNFETGSANLTADSTMQIQNFAKVLHAYPSVNIQVQGHTDNTGNSQANRVLSLQRATSVKMALLGSGVDAQRVDAAGYGQEKPVADNSTEAGRAENRRVTVMVTSK